MALSSVTMSSLGGSMWLPIVGSPTVAMVKVAQSALAQKDSWFFREIVSRGASVSAVALSAFEATGHAFATVGCCLGLVGRILVRIINRGLAGAVGAVWGLVYGNLFTFSISVWLGRIVINVYLLARDVSIAWKHWLERTIACADLFWLGVRLWAIAGKVDAALAIPFNQERLMHHAGQTWSHLAFSCANSLVGFVSPKAVIKSCQTHDLGRSMPPPPLRQRMWETMTEHKAITVCAAGILAIGADYLISQPASTSEYALRLQKHAGDVAASAVQWTFGLLHDIPTVIRNFSEYLKENAELIKANLERIRLGNELKRNELLKQAYLCKISNDCPWLQS